VFSQFYSSALYLNPALAGVERESFFGTNYRSQWSSLALPFNTFQASYIHPLYNGGIRKKHLGGFGASMLNDVAGPNKEFVTQSMSFAAAWNVRINHNDNNTISFALQGSIGQQRFNYDQLHWSSQYSAATGYDPTMAGENSMANLRMFKSSVTTGMLWSYRSAKNGMSFYDGIVVNNHVFKTHGGLTKPLSGKLDISPNYLVVVQGATRLVNIGAYASYSMLNVRGTMANIKLIAGAWYRLHDGLIFSAGIATKKINVGFSYDNNIASMGRTFGYAGAYELSISYRAPGKNNFKRISSPLI
jgi:type IX secretion system PorP/SprF family membrane protein